MGTDLDVIGAIEAAYDAAAEDAAWLERLARAVGPAFGGVGPTTAFFFDLRPAKREYFGTFASVGSAPQTREQIEKRHALATPEELRKAFECDMLTLLSRVVGEKVTAETLRSSGMAGGGDALDSLGLRANVTPDSGIILTTLVRWGFRIRHRTLWLRLAAHIGAGLRLRQARRKASPEDAAAVLTPAGKLEHGATGVQAARADLAQAAKAMDRARGKLRRVDPDEASALWRAMVRSEWSLVDWFDHDGKRFLLAQSNRVAPERTRRLAPREHQAVACAAMGHSNKLIGYDLGLSAGTVSVLLSRAATKLGVSTRPALIRAFRDLAPPEAPVAIEEPKGARLGRVDE